MTSARSAARRAVGSPALLAGVLALAMLGPVLRPGVTIAYDMAWSPSPLWTPFVMGVGTPTPRVVPSDAVAVLVGRVLSAGLAQKVILVAILSLAGAGAAALLRQVRPQVSSLALGAAVIAMMWNAFVTERLAIGQWTVLLGYAVLPWLIRSALRVRDGTAGPGSAAPWLVLAAAGGANSLVIALLGLAVLVCSPPRWRAVRALLLVWVGVAAAWALPSLGGVAVRVSDGVTEFLPSSDTPFGVVVSLVSGGGFWNAATHPASREDPLIAALVTLLALSLAGVAARQLWRGGSHPVLVVALLGLTACLASVTFPTAWTAVVTTIPGGGLLRDSHKLLAPWLLLVALGAGLAVDALRARAWGRPWATAAAVVLTLVPIALLPTLAWGVGGRLQSVEVPEGYRQVADSASMLPRGVVGLLPWSQYRRYTWNGSRVSLTVAPRAIDQPILFDDALPLATGTVAGEDPRAARVTQRIQQGMNPAQALVEEGVDYLVIELSAGLPAEVPQGVGVVVARSAELVVIDMADGSREPVEPSGWLLLGWGTSLLTAVFVLVAATTARVRRRHIGL